MKLLMPVLVILLRFLREGAGSEGCGKRWRRLGERCVAVGSELQQIAGLGFQGAEDTCFRNGASLLVISLADISALLGLVGRGDPETYFWTGGTDDQRDTPESSDGLRRKDEGEQEDDVTQCWAARFQEQKEFVELTRAPCETALDFICQKPIMNSNCVGVHCEQTRRTRTKRQIPQDPFGDVLSVDRRTPKAEIAPSRFHQPWHRDPLFRLYPFAPVTFSPDASDHPAFSFHAPHISVPVHQGGNAMNLESLFATDRGDRSNLRDPKPEGLDYTDNLQSRENYPPDAKGKKIVSETNLTSANGGNLFNSFNQMNMSHNLTAVLPIPPTAAPGVRPRSPQRISLTQSTRKLQFVTPLPILQLNTKENKSAVPDETASTQDNPNGCLSQDHLAYSTSCYVILRKRDTFMNGLSACMSVDSQAYSAIITGTSEGDVLKRYYMREGVSVWLGLHRRDARGIFKWLDDSPVIYSNWARHEPAAIGDCIYASTYSIAGAWFTDDCNATRSMLCEYPRKLGAKLSAPAVSSGLHQCAEGWSYNSKTNSCYKLMKHGGQTQAVAESNCQLFGGHLVSIGSQEEANFIRRVVESSNFVYSTFWVGLQQTDSGHEWLDGTASVYVRWRRGQPDNHQGRERCTTAYKRTMELSDTNCHAYFSYMCKVPSGMSTKIPELGTVPPAPPCPSMEGWALHKNYCYKIFSKRDSFFKTWNQANLHCRKNNAQLASVLDEEENAFMLSQVYTLPDEVLWLGGHANLDTGYTWTDGSAFVFINWKKGEPNNLHDQESCLSMYPAEEAYWNDDNCGMLAGWVCKKPVVEPSTTPTTTTSSSVGLCDKGWVNTGKKCVKLFEQAMTFEDARLTCKKASVGADLVSIGDKKDQAVLSALVGSMDRGVWLGMVYTDIYRWVDQSSVHYTNWAPGEPNNNFASRGKELRSGFSIKNANGQVIVFNRASNSVSMRNLLFPHSLKKVPSMTSSPTQFLVHGRKRRSAGQERQPEDCVEMHSNIRGNKWNDVSCGVLLPFLCQKPLDSSIESPGVPAFCGKPFENYQNYSGACYSHVKDPRTWKDAREYCQRDGAELLSIETISENSYAYLLAETQGAQTVWIGFKYLNQSNRFEWSDGYPAIYSNWAAEEPTTDSDDANPKFCVELSTQDTGEWRAVDCDLAKPFICKYRPGVIPTPDPAVQGSCPDSRWADLGGSFCYYVDEKDHFTWNRANRQCQDMSAELVSIHSPVEMNYMARLVAHHSVSLWTGLVRGSGTFVWSDGSPYDYQNWAPFEPNGANEKCVEMLLAERVWNDISCGVLRGFVCKIPKEPYPETTPGHVQTSSLEKLSQRQGERSELSKGGIAALVVACVVLAAAGGYILHTYRNNLRVNRPVIRPAAATSFDNALYNPDSLEDPILGNIESDTPVVMLSTGTS